MLLNGKELQILTPKPSFVNIVSNDVRKDQLNLLKVILWRLWFLEIHLDPFTQNH